MKNFASQIIWHVEHNDRLDEAEPATQRIQQAHETKTPGTA
jgi:hypothetical protein